MTERPRGLGALLDTRNEFFRPLWIRLLVMLAAAGWAVFEFTNGQTFWGVAFGAFAAMSAYGFFFDPQRASAKPKPDETDNRM